MYNTKTYFASKLAPLRFNFGKNGKLEREALCFRKKTIAHLINSNSDHCFWVFITSLQFWLNSELFTGYIIALKKNLSCRCRIHWLFLFFAGASNHSCFSWPSWHLPLLIFYIFFSSFYFICLLVFLFPLFSVKFGLTFLVVPWGTMLASLCDMFVFT